jgi:hypothetical protein
VRTSLMRGLFIYFKIHFNHFIVGRIRCNPSDTEASFKEDNSIQCFYKIITQCYLAVFDKHLIQSSISLIYFRIIFFFGWA